MFKIEKEYYMYITSGVGIAFVGEASPEWRDDGDDGQDESQDGQGFGAGRHSHIALLHLLILASNRLLEFKNYYHRQTITAATPQPPPQHLFYQ